MLKHIHAVGLAAVALLALGSLVASSASAAGPLWLAPSVVCKEEAGQFANESDCLGDANKGAGTSWNRTINPTPSRLQAGQVLSGLARTKAGSVTTFIGEGTTIECSPAHAEGSITGGMPGTGGRTVTFSGCTVAGKTETECHVRGQGEPVGTITISVKGELVYTGSKVQAEKEEGPIGTLLSPPEGATTFVTLSLEGTKCQTSGLVKVKGNVVAETSPAPGTVALWGISRFPNPPIKTAFVWESAGKVKEVKPSLKAFGVANNIVVGEQESMLTDEEGLEGGVTDN